MEKKEIEELFEQVSKHFDIVPEEAKKFFTMFVEETLEYRDELVAKGEPPLTVEEVQKALSMLEEVLVTKMIKTNIDPRIDNLLKRWILKLKV